jgi:hypothetical protein
MAKLRYRHLTPDDRHPAEPAARGLETCWRCGKPIKLANTTDEEKRADDSTQGLPPQP